MPTTGVRTFPPEVERVLVARDWVFLVGRPYTLFGASLYQAWFDPPKILDLLGASLTDNLYLEEHPNVVRRYVSERELEQFTAAIKKIVIGERPRAKTILERGIEVSEIAKKYLLAPPFDHLQDAVDFLVDLALPATVFSYFSYPIATETNDNELAELAERLRAVSVYPEVVARVLNPLARREAGDAYNFLTIGEILKKRPADVEARERAHRAGKRFVYANVGGAESVFFVDDVVPLIERLESVLLGESVRGQVAFPGKARGRARVILTNDIHSAFDDGDILIAVTTNPTLMPLIKKAAAIVTDEGGVTSHAAIISRELRKPCVVGTRYATHIFKNGQQIDVDADVGVARALA